MIWIAGLVTLSIGAVAFVFGYRASTRHLKMERPFKLSDQAENFPDAAGIIGWLLPRPFKAIWAGLCLLASMIIVGALTFFAVGGLHGSVSEVALTIGIVLVWAGMMFGFGSACEQVIRSRRASAANQHGSRGSGRVGADPIEGDNRANGPTGRPLSGQKT